MTEKNNGQGEPLPYSTFDSIIAENWPAGDPEINPDTIIEEAKTEFKQIYEIINEELAGYDKADSYGEKIKNAINVKEVKYFLGYDTENLGLVEEILNEALGFDYPHSYYFKTINSVYTSEVTDTEDLLDISEWEMVEIENELDLLVLSPHIRIEEIGLKFYARIVAETYVNGTGGLETEYVAIPAENIRAHLPTIQQKKLAARAMEAADVSIVDAVVVDDEDEDNYYESLQTRAEKVELAKSLDSRLKSAIDAIKLMNNSNTLYENAEEATAAGFAFAKAIDLKKLIEDLSGFEVIFSGNSIIETNRIDTDESSITKPISFEVDSENLFKSTEYILPKKALVLGARIMPKRLDEQEDSFVPTIMLLVAFETVEHTYVIDENTPLTSISINERALVPLNGDADINLYDIEKHNEIQSALTKLHNSPKGELIFETIQNIKDELYKETGEFQDFSNIKLIHNLSDKFNKLVSEGIDMSLIEDAVEALFTDLQVAFNGDCYYKADNGVYELDVELSACAGFDDEYSDADSAKMNEGRVIGVSSNILKNRLVLIIEMLGGANYYVPLKSISRLQF